MFAFYLPSPPAIVCYVKIDNQANNQNSQTLSHRGSGRRDNEEKK
jgi:hypothetical protein